MRIDWALRKVMASRDVWTGKELRELLAQRADFSLSAPSISALMKKKPTQVKTETLQALCTALQCTPNEIYGVEPPRQISLAEVAAPDDAPTPE